jgi:hypothetical protein
LPLDPDSESLNPDTKAKYRTDYLSEYELYEVIFITVLTC